MKAVFIGVIAIVVLGGVWYVSQSTTQQDAMMKEEGAMMENTETKDVMQKDGTMMDEPADAAMMKKEADAATMSDDTMMKTGDDAMMKKDDDTMMKEDDATMMHKDEGAYVPYRADALASAAEAGHAVLFFRASWCPTCRAVDADITAHRDAIPAGVTIFDVNYDTETALKQKYGVTYQHTFVEVDAAGNLIKKWSGSPTLAALLGELS